jgi:hypothetical protein
MAGAFRAMLAGLPGWNANANTRIGKWRFVPFSSSAGESADSMTQKFRHANNLCGRIHNDLFIYRSDLLRENLGADDTVVLIDDFVGTGDQVCDAWNEQFGELLTEVGNVHLIVIAACDDGVNRIREDIDLAVVSHYPLRGCDNIFATTCKHFTPQEKQTLLKYCEIAGPGEPKGKGDCGLVVVFAHTCPNNSIPILHSQLEAWEGLFRRYN